MRPYTYWNGETTRCRRVMVSVGNAERESHWHHGLEGTVRKAVEVTYGGNTFYLDDEQGDGWRKVTEGYGGPGWPSWHLPDSSIVVEEIE